MYNQVCFPSNPALFYAVTATKYSTLASFTFLLYDHGVPSGPITKFES
jgi:hypothetical protein